MGLHRYGPGGIGIPNDNVGVRAWGYHSLQQQVKNDIYQYYQTQISTTVRRMKMLTLYHL